MRDDLSQEKPTEIWHFLQIFWKDGLFKRDCVGIWSFLHHMEGWYFSPKTCYFFPGRKMRGDPSQEIHGNMIFLCTRAGVTNVMPHSPAKKNQRWSYLAKIHLKVIGILDWHSRKGSSNSLYFHGDLYRRFLILLSCKKPLKKQET